MRQIYFTQMTKGTSTSYLQGNMKIGIFFSHFASSEYLQTLFEWCREQLIVNIFVALYAQPQENLILRSERVLNIFTFNPFGPFYVINVTGSQTYKSFFSILNSNFHHHQLQLGYPFTFHHNKESWLTVFQLMNASYTFPKYNYTKRSEFFDNGFAQLFAQEKLAELSVYPLMMLTQLILVPEAPHGAA